MNLFKKLFSKKKKVKETQENLIDEVDAENYDSAYGDTVILNTNESNAYEISNDKTVLLNYDQLVSENDDLDLHNVTVALQQDQFPEFMDQQVYHKDADKINGETVILNQNSDTFHSGDTVILNKGIIMNQKSNQFRSNSFLINPSTGEKVLISNTEFKIGSDESVVNLVISKEGISRHHASIFIDKNKDNYIVDNGSTNGTEIEGKALVPFKKYLLENGVLVMFANEVFQFFVEE